MATEFKDKLTYAIAIAVTLIWAGSHVVSWLSVYKVPSSIQGAMMAVISALFTKPHLCKVLKNNGCDK